MILLIIIKMIKPPDILLNVTYYIHKNYMTFIILIHYAQIKKQFNKGNYHYFNKINYNLLTLNKMKKIVN
jgi:hypothetical protein